MEFDELVCCDHRGYLTLYIVDVLCAEKVLKKLEKTCKKVLTRNARCGIIYKSTRYGTE